MTIDISPPSPSWAPHGAFKVSRAHPRLLVKLDFFDEEFREFARARKATWSGLEKAWVFPLSKEADVLHGLTELDAARTERQTRSQSLMEDIHALMLETPFHFHSPKLNVVYEASQRQFHVRFPYNEEVSQRLRRAGGRWNGELKLYAVPAQSLPTILDLVAAPRREEALFEERNAPWRAKEASSPLVILSTWNPAGLDAKSKEPAGHVLKVEADFLECSYRVGFPFGIDSPLGQECLRPHLFDHGAMDVVRPEDVARHYPKINQNSAIFEFSQREKLERALVACQGALDALGPIQRVEISNDGLEGRRWSERHVEPTSGEVLLRSHQAWLISKATRGKSKTTIKGHHISAADAKMRIDRLQTTSRRRVCDMAGIDFEGLEPYVESLLLRESVQATPVETGVAKPRRL